jgi:two-component system cell cycle sensor histidine kinase PleC
VLTDHFDRISHRVGGAQSLKRLLFAVGAFFILLTILALTKFYFDNKRFTAQTKQTFSQSMSNQATDVSRRIDTQIAWIDQALFTEGTAKQIVEFIGQREAIDGVALVDASGTVMAKTGSKGDILTTIDSRSYPKGDVQLLSLVNKNGSALPVIIRRRNDVFLLTAFSPKTFIGDLSPNAALIMDGGRVIDGGDNIGSADALSVYDINAQRLAGLTKSSETSSLIPFEIGNQNVWLGTARVPKSFLSVIDIQPRGIDSGIKENLILFGLLLLGMGWLIWMMASQLLRQMDILRERQNSDEVSTQRYQAAVDNSKGGVWEIDLAKNTAYLSPSLAKVFNMPEIHTTISMSQFLGLFMASDRERLFAAIRRSHINGDFDIELGLAHLPIYMACRGRPSVRGSDQAKVIIGMALDITEMRGAQARLQAAETRLFDALKSMTDSFVIWDQMDRLLVWNERFEDFFGFRPGQLQVGSDHATVEYHGMQTVLSVTERPEGNEMELQDGRWIRYSETRTADGGRVSIGTEVTAIRSRERELQVNQDALEKTISVLRESQIRIVELAENYEQEKIRAEEASQSKSEFLANMSHELRTPLNAINGFSDIMQKELFGPLGDPRYKEYVNDILFSGQHLLSLINDILDMSKIEAGKMTLNTEELQINDMIEQVVRIVRGRADENKLKLVFDEKPAKEVEADPRAVKQVLLNLMTNAIKFTPEGGVVTIAVEPKSAGLIIRITDTGIGISKENIERLAQPFEQIDSQHSRQHEGTGLGLALSKSLVELHGGNFNIESKVGQGTTVTFTLPTKPPVVEEKVETTEVGSEITKLANDIADVLSAGQATVEASKSKTGEGQQNPSSQQSRPQSQAQPQTHAQTAPPQQAQPNPAAPPIRKAPPPPQNGQKGPQSETSRLSNPYTDSAA